MSSETSAEGAPTISPADLDVVDYLDQRLVSVKGTLIDVLRWECHRRRRRCCLIHCQRQT